MALPQLSQIFCSTQSLLSLISSRNLSLWVSFSSSSSSCPSNLANPWDLWHVFFFLYCTFIPSVCSLISMTKHYCWLCLYMWTCEIFPFLSPSNHVSYCQDPISNLVSSALPKFICCKCHTPFFSWNFFSLFISTQLIEKDWMSIKSYIQGKWIQLGQLTTGQRTIFWFSIFMSPPLVTIC